MTDPAIPLSNVVSPQVSRRDERLGIVLVFLSALMWSLGGAIGRFIEIEDI